MQKRHTHYYIENYRHGDQTQTKLRHHAIGYKKNRKYKPNYNGKYSGYNLSNQGTALLHEIELHILCATGRLIC